MSKKRKDKIKCPKCRHSVIRRDDGKCPICVHRAKIEESKPKGK